MDKADGIDASLGLDYCLPLFRRYRKNGFLRASMRHIPRLSGTYEATLVLEKGEVLESFLLDKRGVKQAIALEVLARVDRERGPFEWRFYEQAPAIAAPHSAPPSDPLLTPPSPIPAPVNPGPLFQLTGNMVPVMISSVNWDLLQSWTTQQKHLLFTVITLIDGKRTLADIQMQTSLSPALVNEAMRILLGLQTITFSSF